MRSYATGMNDLNHILGFSDIKREFCGVRQEEFLRVLLRNTWSSIVHYIECQMFYIQHVMNTVFPTGLKVEEMGMKVDDSYPQLCSVTKRPEDDMFEIELWYGGRTCIEIKLKDTKLASHHQVCTFKIYNIQISMKLILALKYSLSLNQIPLAVSVGLLEEPMINYDIFIQGNSTLSMNIKNLRSSVNKTLWYIIHKKFILPRNMLIPVFPGLHFDLQILSPPIGIFRLYVFRALNLEECLLSSKIRDMFDQEMYSNLINSPETAFFLVVSSHDYVKMSTLSKINCSNSYYQFNEIFEIINCIEGNQSINIEVRCINKLYSIDLKLGAIKLHVTTEKWKQPKKFLLRRNCTANVVLSCKILLCSKNKMFIPQQEETPYEFHSSSSSSVGVLCLLVERAVNVADICTKDEFRSSFLSVSISDICNNFGLKHVSNDVKLVRNSLCWKYTKTLLVSDPESQRLEIVIHGSMNAEPIGIIRIPIFLTKESPNMSTNGWLKVYDMMGNKTGCQVLIYLKLRSLRAVANKLSFRTNDCVSEGLLAIHLDTKHFKILPCNSFRSFQFMTYLHDTKQHMYEFLSVDVEKSGTRMDSLGASFPVLDKINDILPSINMGLKWEINTGGPVADLYFGETKNIVNLVPTNLMNAANILLKIILISRKTGYNNSWILKPKQTTPKKQIIFDKIIKVKLGKFEKFENILIDIEMYSSSRVLIGGVKLRNFATLMPPNMFSGFIPLYKNLTIVSIGKDIKMTSE